MDDTTQGTIWLGTKKSGRLGRSVRFRERARNGTQEGDK